jgi:hypothetical protein
VPEEIPLIRKPQLAADISLPEFTHVDFRRPDGRIAKLTIADNLLVNRDGNRVGQADRHRRWM